LYREKKGAEREREAKKKTIRRGVIIWSLWDGACAINPTATYTMMVR
jgi:hypothetical protein